MLEVTCFHCGQIVQISPDAERCSVCGTNLRKLIGKEQSSNYFYTRAADYAAAGNVLAALQEVQRGLAYVNTSELHLLGAILCKRLGRWEDMRNFVAAIPADDPLRGEGEWLVRSNQARQRPANPGRGKAPVALPIVPDSDALPVVMDEVSPSPNYRKATSSSRSLAVLAALTMLVVLVGTGWIVTQNGWFSGLSGQQTVGQTVSQSSPGVMQPAASAPTVVPVLLKDSPASVTQDEVPAEQPADSAAPAPTAAVAPDLVQAVPTPQAIASTSDDMAAKASDLSRLDWRGWLAQRGRSDLAVLPVTTRVEGRTLVLEGTVDFAEQRAALEFEARQVPGVDTVSLVNVTVRPPKTYTVAEGDSLWAISVRIYGNAERVEELYAANRDQMASAADLSIGMVLNVPPLE